MGGPQSGPEIMQTTQSAKRADFSPKVNTHMPAERYGATKAINSPEKQIVLLACSNRGALPANAHPDATRPPHTTCPHTRIVRRRLTIPAHSQEHPSKWTEDLARLSQLGASGA